MAKCKALMGLAVKGLKMLATYQLHTCLLIQKHYMLNVLLLICDDYMLLIDHELLLFPCDKQVNFYVSKLFTCFDTFERNIILITLVICKCILREHTLKLLTFLVSLKQKCGLCECNRNCECLCLIHI